jgi:hypothetical protein
MNWSQAGAQNAAAAAEDTGGVAVRGSGVQERHGEAKLLGQTFGTPELKGDLPAAGRRVVPGHGARQGGGQGVAGRSLRRKLGIGEVAG